MDDAWVRKIFESKIAKRGGMARRSIKSIAKCASLDKVKRACTRRRYHIVEHGDQWIIFCDHAHVKIIR
jgi:hypothetical protein